MTQDLKKRMAEMGIVAKKALGQNFLINPYVIDRIVQAVRAKKTADVLEIGPGLGALTEPLLTGGLKPRLIELDTDLAEYWLKRGLEVHQVDALKLDWNTLALPSPTLLVSNLPYQISTHLVIDRCFGPQAIQAMILMFQKEVAQRLTALPRSKDYGLLSVMAQLHFRMTKVADAAPGDFYPAPKIASRVLAFERLSDPGLGLPFLKFLKASFAFRRKYLLKNLKSVVHRPKLEQLPEIAESLGIAVKARAEELTPQQFVELFKRIYEH